MFGERWYHQNEEWGKGSAFAVLDVKNYLKESERQFHNIQHKEPLPNDPTKLNLETVWNVIGRFQRENQLCKNIT